MDLSEFLAARLAEDEAAAKAAVGQLSGRWEIDGDRNVQDEDAGGGGNSYVACGPYGGGLYAADAVHIARHDPARVLREVEAMRKILDEHAPVYPVTFPEPSGQPRCGVCHAGGWDWDPEDWPCPTVRLLAAVWSDHPDYDEAWKP